MFLLIILFVNNTLAVSGYFYRFGSPKSTEYCYDMALNQYDYRKFAIAGSTNNNGEEKSFVAEFFTNGTLSWKIVLSSTISRALSIISLKEGGYAILVLENNEVFDLIKLDETGGIVFQSQILEGSQFIPNLTSLIETSTKEIFLSGSNQWKLWGEILLMKFDGDGGLLLSEDAPKYGLESGKQGFFGEKLLHDASYDNLYIVGYSDYPASTGGVFYPTVVHVDGLDSHWDFNILYCTDNRTIEIVTNAIYVESSGVIVAIGYETTSDCMFITFIKFATATCRSYSLCAPEFSYGGPTYFYPYDIDKIGENDYLIVGALRESRDPGDADEIGFILQIVDQLTLIELVNLQFNELVIRLTSIKYIPSWGTAIVVGSSPSEDGHEDIIFSLLDEVDRNITCYSIDAQLPNPMDQDNAQIYIETVEHEPTTLPPISNSSFTPVWNSSLNRTDICKTCFGRLDLEEDLGYVCSGNGKCTEFNYCDCEEMYVGLNCSILDYWYCYGYGMDNFSIVCSGHGNCTGMDSCDCDGGYVGDNCDDFDCFDVGKNDTENVCSGHGECVSPNNCVCQPDYDYDYTMCSVWTCYNTFNIIDNVCSGHGNCTAKDDCECQAPNYDGEKCEKWDCFDVENEYPEIVCSGHGNCTSYDDCECSTNYQFAVDCSEWTCFFLLNVADMVCSGHGNCTSYDLCDCWDFYDYGRENCDVWKCFEYFSNDTLSVCSDHGDCDSHDYCACDQYYTGKDCNIFMCGDHNNTDPLACTNHGDCIDVNTCSCEAGYFGEFCGVWECYGTMNNETLQQPLCSDRGFCEDINHCICAHGWDGLVCNITTCYGYESDDRDVCNGNGICEGPDICTCFEGYDGIDCEIYLCNTYLYNDTLRRGCTSRGSCEAPESCKCDEADKYYGQYCEVTVCGEMMSNESYVCLGHGLCLEYEKCTCASLYDGDNCDMYTCFNVPSNLSTVCGGHGYCYSSDRCACFDSYKPPDDAPEDFYECTDFTCGGYSPEDEKVCSKMKGECIEPDICDCSSSGYEGTNCETYKCGNYFHDDPGACDGSGICTSPGTCVCQTWYKQGEFCEDSILFPVIFVPTTVVFTLSMCLVFILLISMVVCICCSWFLVCAMIMFFVTRVVVRQRRGIRKYKKLRNFDLYLQEQLLEDNSSAPSFRINKENFKIDYDSVKPLELLGSGGSNSLVFRANWEGRIVAFKCYKTKSLMSSEDEFQEFEKEVKILSSVSHPSIVRFFGCSLKPPRVGIAMEYCENGEILDFFESFDQDSVQRYPIEQKIRMCAEIASALNYLHSRSIIHRDLKPANVLVDGKEKIRVMDFGLSRVKDDSDDMTRKIGTSYFMAPELIDSSMEYTEKCDVFSFGITLWMIFTENRKPYGKIHNVQHRVAFDPELRPKIEELEESLKGDDGEDDYSWILEMVTASWTHLPNTRPSFEKITVFFQEKGMKIGLNPLPLKSVGKF